MTDERRATPHGDSMTRVYLCVTILSAGVLAYEILLTRLLSVVQ